MKKLLVCLLILVVCIVVLWVQLKPNNQLAQVKNYRIYYGEVNEKIIDDMARYDALVVEGLQFSAENIKRLQQKSVDSYDKDRPTLLLGYLSVMEIGKWDKEVLGRLKASDYLQVQGKKAYAPAYQNYLGNITQEHYQEVLLKTIEKRILAKKMNGVFLDTVDWIESYRQDKKLYPKLLAGYERFLKKIHERFPDMIIVQNRGLGKIALVSAPYIDGILWENYIARELPEGQGSHAQTEQLQKLNRDMELVIFTVSYNHRKENKEAAEKLGWVHWQVEDSTRYNRWYFQ